MKYDIKILMNISRVKKKLPINVLNLKMLFLSSNMVDESWYVISNCIWFFFLYFIQQYYRHTSRELKRIASVTLSPIYAHFSETITGLVTIRAFRATER